MFSKKDTEEDIIKTETSSYTDFTKGSVAVTKRVSSNPKIGTKYTIKEIKDYSGSADITDIDTLIELLQAAKAA